MFALAVKTATTPLGYNSPTKQNKTNYFFFFQTAVLWWGSSLGCLPSQLSRQWLSFYLRYAKAKCRHLKDWPAKGLYRLEIHVDIFDLVFWTVASLTFFLVQLSPPSLCQSTEWLGVGAGGVESCWRPCIFCRSLTLCISPDSKPPKLLDHLKQKPRRGGGLRQINTCRKVPNTSL